MKQDEYREHILATPLVVEWVSNGRKAPEVYDHWISHHFHSSF